MFNSLFFSFETFLTSFINKSIFLPFLATIGTTLTPKAFDILSISILVPLLSTSSIILSATTVGIPVSNI